MLASLLLLMVVRRMVRMMVRMVVRMMVRMIMLMVDWTTPELMRYTVMARTCSKKPISAK